MTEYYKNNPDYKRQIADSYTKRYYEKRYGMTKKNI